MSWFNKHLNWTYVIFLVVSIIVSAVIISISREVAYLVIATIVSLVLNLVGGGWVLYKKGQNLWLLVLAALISIVFIIIVLMAENKNESTGKKNAITDEDYYKSRGKK